MPTGIDCTVCPLFLERTHRELNLNLGYSRRTLSLSLCYAVYKQTTLHPWTLFAACRFTAVTSTVLFCTCAANDPYLCRWCPKLPWAVAVTAMLAAGLAVVLLSAGELQPNHWEEGPVVQVRTKICRVLWRCSSQCLVRSAMQCRCGVSLYSASWVPMPPE